MLTVETWDEIAMVWGTAELDLPADCRDPEAINLALGRKMAENEEGDGWLVTSHATTESLLLIESRSDRNHRSVILVGLDVEIA